MKTQKIIFLIMAALMLSNCGTRTSASVEPTANRTPAKLAEKSPDSVIISEKDITNKRYESLGDIEVTVSKWTIFDSDPTKEKVAAALKEKAASMGADAVVLVRYGTVGVSALSWGSMDGKGRAVVFK